MRKQDKAKLDMQAYVIALEKTHNQASKMLDTLNGPPVTINELRNSGIVQLLRTITELGDLRHTALESLKDIPCVKRKLKNEVEKGK